MKGIIFGMRATDEEKLRVIEVIRKKCSEHKRTDFKFLQAYYCPECGDIRTRELPMIDARVAFQDSGEGPNVAIVEY